jgi:hypothetical protein
MPHFSRERRFFASAISRRLHQNDQIKGGRMRHLLIGITAAATIAVIGLLRAQAQQPWPAAPYPAQHFPFAAPTPEDAYRQGLINRWELQRYAGPMPQALQGPSVDGNRGSDSDLR